MSNTTVILQVLAFLGTASLLVAAIVAAGWSVATGRLELARRAMMLGGFLAATYLVALIAASALSHTRILPVATEKYFCELDCHLAYEVTEVRELGSEGSGAADHDTILVVLRTRFDENTISARRSRTEPTWPAPRRVELIDAAGQRYAPLPDPADILSAIRFHSTAISQELAPGESYLTAIAFELPHDVPEPSLLLTDDLLVSRFLIGHERSFLHAPVLLSLPPQFVASKP
jgi:hypothetical protein